MQNNQNKGNQKPTLGERVVNFGNGLADMAKPGLINKVKGGYNLIKAVVGRNSKGWYIKYVTINPAKNLTRQMDPLFNLSLTDQPAKSGAITRFIDVHAKWTGYIDSYMFDRTVTEMFQLLRMRLKSNLPYKQNAVKAYLGQAIAIATLVKQLERDVQWNLYSAPDVHNFQKMWRLSSYSETYGLVGLSPIIYLSDAKWPYTSAAYDRMADVFNYSIKLPESLGEFISHYCGSLFVADTDGKNDQFIRFYIDTIDWPDYDPSTDTITTTAVSLVNLSPDELIDMINNVMQKFSIVIADLTNSNQLTFSRVSKLGQYTYNRVYDKTFLQALVNGYTSRSAMTKDGYIRLDQLQTDDDLTQYLFLGGLQDKSNPNDKANVPAIAIKNMVYKFDSDSNLKWPSGLFQQGDGTEFFRSTSPFGVAISTDVSIDTYVGVTSGNAKYFLFGEKITLGTGATTLETQYMSEHVTLQYLPDPVNRQNFLPIAAHVLGTSEANKVKVVYRGIMFTYDPSNKRITTSVAVVRKIIPSTGGIDDPGQVALNLAIIASKFIARDGTNPVPNVKEFTDDGWEADSTGWSSSGFEDTTTLLWPLDTPLGIVYQAYVDIKAGVKSLKWSGTEATGYTSIYNDSYFASNYMSPIYVIVNNATTVGKVAATSGFPLLAPWAADQFDYHLPMLIKSSVHVKNGDAADLIFSQGSVLVKEAYEPYFYQVNDLVPVLYDMFTSLFATGAREELTKNQKKNNRQNVSKGPDKGLRGQQSESAK